MTDERWNGFLDRLKPFRKGETTGATEYFSDVQKRKGNDADLGAWTRDHHANIEVLNDVIVALVNDAANRKRDVSELQEEAESGRSNNDRLRTLLWVALSLVLAEALLLVLAFLVVG